MAKTNKPKKPKGLSKEEIDAMKEYMKEKKRIVEGNNNESAVLEKIAKLPAQERAMATRLHKIIKAAAPTLNPRTWYGFPAYANKDGNIICFFQYGSKFKSRYSTLGFSDKSKLDDGRMWPTVYALKELTPTEEAKIVALVKKAVG
ncbi:MAG: iron chaperone [Candidatus Micrarchaeales archaeon]